MRCNKKQPSNLGSSETTREAPLNSKKRQKWAQNQSPRFKLSNYFKRNSKSTILFAFRNTNQEFNKYENQFDDYWQYGIPQHLKSSSNSSKLNMETFLEWFIGFSEGAGSFNYSQTSNRKQVDFLVVQKDPKILFLIKKTLGFGQVYAIDNKKYWRYQAGNQKNCYRLFYLFNGNFRLIKTKNRFKQWTNLLDSSLKIQNQIRPIHLDNAWLSGFIEADGGFYGRVRSNQKYRTGKQFLKKFYITQKGEKAALQQILTLLKSKSHIQNIDGVTDIWRIEIHSLESHQNIINYLLVYSLKGNKKIGFKIWHSMHLYQQKGEHLQLHGLVRLSRLCSKLNSQNGVNTKEKSN